MSPKSTHITDLFGTLPTPSYIIDENVLRRNGEILASVAAHTGCKILLAQKAFSNYDFYPLLSGYLSGTEASGLYEARLGAEEMPDKEVHVFCGAYRDDEFEELLTYADHIVFNSPHQFKKFAQKAKAAGKASVCALIPNVPHRTDMRSMTRVRPAAALVQRAPYGTIK